MGKPLSQEQIDATVRAQAKFPDNMAAASRSLGIGHHTYTVRLASLRHRGVPLVDQGRATLGASVNEALAYQKQADNMAALRGRLPDPVLRERIAALV